MPEIKEISNKCSNCGTISLGLSETCMNCGSNLSEINKKNQINEKPSESTIEVMAEEINIQKTVFNRREFERVISMV